MGASVDPTVRGGAVARDEDAWDKAYIDFESFSQKARKAEAPKTDEGNEFPTAEKGASAADLLLAFERRWTSKLGVAQPLVVETPPASQEKKEAKGKGKGKSKSKGKDEKQEKGKSKGKGKDAKQGE